jgi:REP element-mobilizing transposase RayT
LVGNTQKERAQCRTLIHSIQLVFAVEGRQSLIAPVHQEEVNKYITGIVRNKGSRMLAVNGIPDHLHVLIGTASVASDLRPCAGHQGRYQ